MIGMKQSIQFYIFKGDKQYVAEGVGVNIVTQGKTLDILSKNIAEAVSLYMEHKDAKKEFKKFPSIFMNMEIPSNV
jgi:predicted RNase H-like HicB family nuclease